MTENASVHQSCRTVVAPFTRHEGKYQLVETDGMATPTTLHSGACRSCRSTRAKEDVGLPKKKRARVALDDESEDED